MNAFEFEEQAQRTLSRAAYATIAGSDRDAFDRITLRPRMVVDCMNLDLTVELAGDRLFAPMLVAPIARQRDYHPDGELGTVRGATAAKTPLIVSEHSSYPLDRIVAEAKTPVWYQVFASADAGARTLIRRAVAAGCKGVCITVRPTTAPPAAPIDWASVDQLHRAADAPVLLKGIMTVEDAKAAAQRRVQGIIVSNGGARGVRPQPVEALPRIVSAIGANVPVLADGGFRRGADVMKALALGARAVLVGRPVMWALAAYGAEGVQSVLELLQMDLARTMAGSGKPTISALDRHAITIHAPRPKSRS